MSERWCLKCGELGTPERAVGVDEDGEPSCRMHSVKLNEPEFSIPQPTKRRAASRGVSRNVTGSSPASTEPAGQPPVVASVEPDQAAKGKCEEPAGEISNSERSDDMLKRSKPVFEDKLCACNCGQNFTPTGAAQKFAPGHKPGAEKAAGVSKRTAKAKTNGHIPRTNGHATASEAAAEMFDPASELSGLRQLKAELKRRLEAVELVEQMLLSGKSALNALQDSTSLPAAGLR
jgi:hypothetical protein